MKYIYFPRQIRAATYAPPNLMLQQAQHAKYNSDIRHSMVNFFSTERRAGGTT
jgi:hypothetical protein